MHICTNYIHEQSLRVTLSLTSLVHIYFHVHFTAQHNSVDWRPLLLLLLRILDKAPMRNQVAFHWQRWEYCFLILFTRGEPAIAWTDVIVTRKRHAILLSSFYSSTIHLRTGNHFWEGKWLTHLHWTKSQSSLRIYRSTGYKLGRPIQLL